MDKEASGIRVVELVDCSGNCGLCRKVQSKVRDVYVEEVGYEQNGRIKWEIIKNQKQYTTTKITILSGYWPMAD